MSAAKSNTPKSRLARISEAANIYGERSFDNYAQIRSLAERVQSGLCAYLSADLSASGTSDKKCVFLVPPQGPFMSQNYGSGAFSVSGKGFLPLEPISFGLGVRVSQSGDFMRIVLHCRKEGERIFMQVEENQNYDFVLPLTDEDVDTCKEGLFQHLLHWFTDRVEHYDHGNYGSTDIGFDIQRIDDA
ncbi:MAG: hypothetical protein COA69_10180 [Robiginitomaculum sp.]|nr:MAG: hypothetical protein COA69_10180 [Robiginitomaculum sp.]